MLRKKIDSELSWTAHRKRLVLEDYPRVPRKELRNFMSDTFVWFHNHSENPEKSRTFYETLLGWRASDGPSMTVFAGAAGPFAGMAAKDGGAAGWLPYAQVEDVDAATKVALTLGGALLKEKTRGPAGEFTVVADPGGAAIALWQKA